MWLPVDTEAAAALAPSAAPETECEAVPAADELGDWETHQFNLDAYQAGKLGVAFGGTALSAGQRLLIREFSRSAVCRARDGSQVRYGTSVRLVVRVDNISAEASFSLPFVAAQAELGQIKAESTLRVLGYVGERLARFMTQPLAFNVDAYALLSQNVNQIQQLIGSDIGNVRPVKLQVLVRESPEDERRERALGLAWALTMIAEGKSCVEAKARFPRPDSPAAIAEIEDIYGKLLGGVCGSEPPSKVARETAKAHLGKLRLRA